MTETSYFVPNISCSHCVHTIKMELQDIDGVRFVEAVEATKQVKVAFEPPATEEQIKATLHEINYPAAPSLALGG